VVTWEFYVAFVKVTDYVTYVLNHSVLHFTTVSCGNWYGFW